MNRIKETLLKQFQTVRQTTLDICRHLENEDFVVQPSPNVSPPKWHLGHTSWLFEEVILKQYKKNTPILILHFASYLTHITKRWASTPFNRRAVIFPDQPSLISCAIAPMLIIKS